MNAHDKRVHNLEVRRRLLEMMQEVIRAIMDFKL